MLFSRGKAISLAPIMVGTNQLPKPPISAGMTMKKIMIEAVAGDEGIPLLAVDDELHARLGELETHQAGERAADRAGEDRQRQVERADVLVSGRGQPVERRESGAGGSAAAMSVIAPPVPCIAIVRRRNRSVGRRVVPAGRGEPGLEVGRRRAPRWRSA